MFVQIGVFGIFCVSFFIHLYHFARNWHGSRQKRGGIAFRTFAENVAVRLKNVRFLAIGYQRIRVAIFFATL